MLLSSLYVSRFKVKPEARSLIGTKLIKVSEIYSKEADENIELINCLVDCRNLLARHLGYDDHSSYVLKTSIGKTKNNITSMYDALVPEFKRLWDEKKKEFLKCKDGMKLIFICVVYQFCHLELDKFNQIKMLFFCDKNSLFQGSIQFDRKHFFDTEK